MRTLLIALLHFAFVLTAQEGGKFTIATAPNDAIFDSGKLNECPTNLVERFSRFSIYAPPQAESMLITQKFELGQQCTDGFFPAKVEVTSNPIDLKTGKVNPKKVWSFSTSGVSGEVLLANLGVYRVDSPACCATTDTSTYFSLNTGELIGSATEIADSGQKAFLQTATANPAKRRFISLEDNCASLPQGTRKSIATIFYSDEKSILERLTLSSKASGDEEEWTVAEFNFVGHEKYETKLELADEKELSKEKIHLLLTCRCDAQPLDIILPLSPDGLNQKAAQITGLQGVIWSK